MKKALVLGLIFAVGLGFSAFAQTLSGHWDTDITIDLTTGSTWPGAVTITSEVVVDYTVGDWTFSSETDIEDGTWNNQDFDFAGVLGAFTISGALEFNPDTPAFVSLDANATVSIAGVTFGAAFDLKPTGTDLTLTGSGTAGDVSIAVTLILGDDTDGCDFDFESVEIDVGFPFCCADVSAELYLTCEGFEYVQFCVSDLTITNLPWLTLDACVKFEEQTKSFTLSPAIDLGVIGCDFDLYYRLESSGGTNYTPLLIDGIQFDGIQIACEIGGVAFTGITYWGPDDHVSALVPGSPGILYGHEDYWEAYQIATTDDGCCGPFSFDVTVFFDENPGATKLFDVAYLIANMEIQVATQFTFSLGIETDVQNNTVNDVTFGFLVEW